MKEKEINQIIANYKPKNGFFDLSKKPDTLNKDEYAKVLKVQEFLFEQNSNKEYIKKFYPNEWENLKVVSAQLQSIVLEHWGDSVFV